MSVKLQNNNKGANGTRNRCSRVPLALIQNVLHYVPSVLNGYAALTPRRRNLCRTHAAQLKKRAHTKITAAKITQPIIYGIMVYL